MNNNMEKIAFGSDLEILAIDSKARIPIIYGNGNINNINIIIENKDASKSYTLTFPLLEGQILSVNDYIGPDGLHIGEEIIKFDSDQVIAYGLFQDIFLYPEYTHIYSADETLVTMKIYYSSIYARDSQIYVLDKYEQLIAVFNRNDDDTLINPRISKEQNSDNVFTFSINLANPKWKEINNPENLYRVENMVFSTNFDNCFEETISENDEKLVKVTAYERQKLLTRKYVRVWNSETNLPEIDIFMVEILSNGILPLKNDGVEIETFHLPGTSGYALEGLLYGTGWTVGECDVEGTFDLETDQLDIYENILKVQELWGGILVFDSVNKVVHHRNESLWLPYNGYEVKYQKNMQSLEKVFNNKIITKLCPLGESGLNIKSVNNDSEWITDFSYTDTVLEGIENNDDITNPEQLLRWGRRKLKDLCKPAIELTVKFLLLHQIDGYELETIDLNDIVDVINFNEVQGYTEQLRVVRFEYGVWDKSDATIDLSDITLESTDIFKKTVTAANIINNGTLSSSKVISYYNNGKSVDETLRQIDTVLETTKTDLTKTDEELTALIEKNTDGIDSITDTIVSHTSQLAELKQTIEGLVEKTSISGGDNLIRNSVGFYGNEYWEGNIISSQETDIRNNNESNSAIVLQNGAILQKIDNLKNGTYNLSFNYKKLKDVATVKMYINNEEQGELTSMNWQSFESVIEVIDNSLAIKFEGNSNDCCWISDLILITGSVKASWSQNANETMTDTVSIGKGIQVDSTTTNTYHRIDSDGNRTYNKLTGEVVSEQTEKGTVTQELTVKSQATINRLLIEEIGDQVWFVGLE